MTSQTLPQTQFARLAAQADGVFCSVCGVAATLMSEGIHQWSGLPSSFLLILGIGLLVYGLGLIGIASARPGNRMLMQAVFGGNVVWIVLSVLLLLVDPFRLTSEGRILVIIIAVLVAGFAWWQYTALRRLP
jgi:hypothetical protein